MAYYTVCTPRARLLLSQPPKLTLIERIRHPAQAARLFHPLRTGGEVNIRYALLFASLGILASCGEQGSPLAPTQIQAVEARPASTSVMMRPEHPPAGSGPHLHAGHDANCHHPPRPTCNDLPATRLGELISVKYTGECHSRPWPRFTVSFGTNPGSLADDFHIFAEPDQSDVPVCGFDGPNASSCPRTSDTVGPDGEWVFVPIPRPSDD